MTNLVILSATERTLFDEPPKLTAKDRSLYFLLTNDILKIVKGLRSPETKVGFVLQLGYFRSNAKFYKTDQFKKSDIEFVSKLLDLDHNLINLSYYQKKISIEHQNKILKILGWKSFSKNQHKKISEYVSWLVQRQMSLKQIFLSIIDFCWKVKTELPSYNLMSIMITDAYNNFENGLIRILDKELSVTQCQMLDELVALESLSSTNKKQYFKITLIKRINQGLKPTDIEDNVDAFCIFKKYFHEFEAVINMLELSDQATEYFATWVQKTKGLQLMSFSEKNKMYLHLLCYIKHQFFQRHDVLVDILLKSTTAATNAAQKNLHIFEKENRHERNKAIKSLSIANKGSREVIDKITEIVKPPILSEPGKIAEIEKLVDHYNCQNSMLNKENIIELEKSLDATSSNKAYFDALESMSKKLQRRISSLIKQLEFNPETSSKDLIPVINYFKTTDGRLDQDAPLEFLNKEEASALYEEGAFRTSFCKILLFSHMSNSIKSGRLNLLYSYKYKAIHEYLIDEETWRTKTRDLLENAGLTSFSDYDATIHSLKLKLNDKYQVVNERYLEGKNNNLKIDKDGKVIISTPKTDSDDKEFISSLLSKSGYIPILQVLSDINHIAQYTESFVHFSIKHKKMTPTPTTIFAGLIGKGCNIGINRIANISVGISEDVLANTVNWCFSLKNIQQANNKVIGYTDKLFLSNAYRHKSDELHTGSDGRKVNVSVDSLHANYSYKYFGKGKGVSVYTFLDERQLLFYSTFISASEREAAYVIDGLQKNEVVKSTIHSTDSHGFTETVFAVSPFVNTAFAPRIKNIGDQKIYSFVARQTYEKKGYKILPSRPINVKLIENYWDDILRFMATIKLKHTPASQLFKRLSSYAKDHPLYQALK